MSEITAATRLWPFTAHHTASPRTRAAAPDSHSLAIDSAPCHTNTPLMLNFFQKMLAKINNVRHVCLHPLLEDGDKPPTGKKH